MKKSLTLLLAMAMVFSMFATVAFADTSTTTSTDIQAKVQALESAGVLNGFPDGSMHLNDNMTRAQFAKVAALILNLNVPTTVTVPSYTDTGSSWASGYIEAATKAGLLNGVGMGKFNPDGNVTTEQMAKVLDLGLKLDTSSTATVSGTVSDWARAYVAAAVNAGLIPPSTNYTTAATRSQLVSAGYAAYQEVKGNGVTVTSSTAVDANTVSVTFSDGVTKQFTLTTPLQLGVAANVPVTYNGVSYTVTVTLQQLSIVKAAATAADTVTVTFNQAVADTANAKATLSELGASVNTTASWSDDKTQLILKADSNLLTGQYTVTIDGLNLSDGQNTASFMVTAAQVSKITIDNTAYIAQLYDKNDAETDFRALAQYETINVGYKLYDQYGNDVTSDYANLRVSSQAGPGTASYSDPGTATIDKVSSVFDTLVVSIVDVDDGVNAVQTVAIKDKQKLDSITLSAPEPHDGDTAISASGVPYVIPVVAKDQYGNDYTFSPMKYDDEDSDGNQIGLSSYVTFISSDPSVLQRTDIDVDSDGNIEITKFGDDFDGTRTVTLTALVNGTGKQSQIQFSVEGKKSPSVPILVPPTTRMSTDNNTDDNPFQIQLKVNDVFGNAMGVSDIIDAFSPTDESDNQTLFISVSGDAQLATPAIVAKDSNAYIQLKATSDKAGSATINVNTVGKYATLTIPITDNKVVTSIDLSVDKSESIYATDDSKNISGQIKLTPTFKDQFGDEVTSDNATTDERAQLVDLYTNSDSSVFAIVDGDAVDAIEHDSSTNKELTTDDVSSWPDSIVTVGDLLDGNVKIVPLAADKSASLTARLHYKPTSSDSSDKTLVARSSNSVSLVVPADASGLTFVADPATVTAATYAKQDVDDSTVAKAVDSAYAVTLGVDGKDGNNTVALPSNAIHIAKAAGSSNIQVDHPSDDTTKWNVAAVGGSDGDQAVVALTITLPGAGANVITVPVTIKTGTPVAQSITGENENGDTVTSVSVKAGDTLVFFGDGSDTSKLHFDVKDQYGTDALNSQLAVYVDGTPEGSSYTVPSDWDLGSKHTITAICNGVVTSVTVYMN